MSDQDQLWADRPFTIRDLILESERQIDDVDERGLISLFAMEVGLTGPLCEYPARNVVGLIRSDQFRDWLDHPRPDLVQAHQACEVCVGHEEGDVEEAMAMLLCERPGVTLTTSRINPLYGYPWVVVAEWTSRVRKQHLVWKVEAPTLLAAVLHLTHLMMGGGES